jgi:RIO-like serine/threonine protein kinase
MSNDSPYLIICFFLSPLFLNEAMTKLTISRAVGEVDSPSELYATLMALLLRLAHCGLVHGDFNEFNILIGKKTGEATLIDFPQMVSTRHINAEL